VPSRSAATFLRARSVQAVAVQANRPPGKLLLVRLRRCRTRAPLEVHVRSALLAVPMMRRNGRAAEAVEGERQDLWDDVVRSNFTPTEAESSRGPEVRLPALVRAHQPPHRALATDRHLNCPPERQRLLQESPGSIFGVVTSGLPSSLDGTGNGTEVASAAEARCDRAE